MTKSQERLLFTLSKIVRQMIVEDSNDHSIENLKALDSALRDFNSYIPYQEAPGGEGVS